MNAYETDRQHANRTARRKRSWFTFLAKSVAYNRASLNKAREIARRKRQIERGILKPNGGES